MSNGESYAHGGCTFKRRPFTIDGIERAMVDAHEADTPNKDLMQALNKPGAVLGGRQQSGPATLKETLRPSSDKVTIEDIKYRTADIRFYLLSGSTTTVCQLTLDNGWTVLGSSACVDPSNFDMRLGEELARKDAERQLWPLLGFLLQERRYRERLATGPNVLRKGAR